MKLNSRLKTRLNINLKNKLKQSIYGLALITTCIALTGCGAKDNTLPPTPLTKYQPKIKINKNWSNSVSQGSGSNAYIIGTVHSDNRIIAAGIGGKIKAISPENGRTLWSKSTKFKFSATPLLQDKMIYIGTYYGKLVAFDTINGTKKWVTQLSSTVLAQPTYSDGKVFVTTNNGTVTAVEAETGKISWKYSAKNPHIILQGDSSPVINPNGNIMYASDNGKVTLLSADNGSVTSSRTMFQAKGDNAISRMVDITSTPIVNQDIMYIMAYQGGLKAIDLHDGREIWSRDNISGYINMGQDLKKIYIVTSDSKVYAIDKASGHTMWMQDKLLGRVLSTPAVLNNKYIILGDYAGYVHFLDASTGELLARYKINSSGINSAASIINNQAVVNTINGKITALTTAKI